MKNIIAIGRERSLGVILTMRQRTPQEELYRRTVKESTLTKHDKTLALMASQEFGELEVLIDVLQEAKDFMEYKVDVAKALLGEA